MTQRDRLLAFMRERGGIVNADDLLDSGVPYPLATVSKLVKDGLVIKERSPQRSPLGYPRRQYRLKVETGA